ncbi:unnamed protein product [Orchesella dallaii]|uniref:Uncharacterized protein n=1 Tax=Orchesella dallaii TaxID=48710 RepID=A0ABP1PXG5_9HEXA
MSLTSSSTTTAAAVGGVNVGGDVEEVEPEPSKFQKLRFQNILSSLWSKDSPGRIPQRLPYLDCKLLAGTPKYLRLATVHQNRKWRRKYLNPSFLFLLKTEVWTYI